MSEFERLWTTDGAAAALGISPRTLDYLRVKGDGPRFVKIGRRVKYRAADLTAYLEERTRTSTADRGKAAA